jgi:PilZ domain
MLKPRATRYPVVEPGILRISGAVGDAYLITVLDVSKSGMRVSCSTALPVETQVEVQCRGSGVTGEVRYARNVGRDEFHLGIEVKNATAGARNEEGELDVTRLFQLP